MYRSEIRFPNVGLGQVDVWDGRQLVRRTIAGQVAVMPSAEAARVVTEVAVDTLDYLHPGSTAVVEMLLAATEGGRR